MNKIITFITIVCILYCLLLCCTPQDSTDKGFWHRSNMALHIDNKTGCHYLSSWSGILMPRLDKNGKQICTGFLEEQ